MTTRPPAYAFTWGLLTIIIVLLIVPASADTIFVDMQDLPYNNTVESTTVHDYKKTFKDSRDTNIDNDNRQLCIYSTNIQTWNNLIYVVEVIPTNMQWVQEGRLELYYRRLSDNTVQPAYLHIQKGRDSTGAIVNTRLTLFPQNWEIGGQYGGQIIPLYADIACNQPYKIPVQMRTGSLDCQDGGSAFIGIFALDPGARPLYAMYNIDYAAVGTNTFKNTISVTPGHIPTIKLYRYNCYSDLTVDCDGVNIFKRSGSGDVDEIMSSPHDNITVKLKSESAGIDNQYIFRVTGSVPDPDDPGDPTDPDGSGITVYVKNSQTGALIANANIAIDALVNGEYYPVVNRTEPSGIFSINLQPTGGGQPNPDGYRLMATADGYYNPTPAINFTVDAYTKLSTYLYLDPIAGGPVNENKTFIDFFVRDMSSNPISGATVKFGPYTLITNSAGYTVFEVDKNNNYSWTISKSGYGALTGNAVIGNDPRHTINTVLAPIVTPTPTTPKPTSPPIGPTPTMTAPTGEPVSNWLEWFAAHFGMILGGGVEIGKIFMWLCFTVPVGVYVGKEAKAGAAGFMAGAGIVTLFFVLIGWVPIWLVVLLALIIGLLYAKVFNSQDNAGGGR